MFKNQKIKLNNYQRLIFINFYTMIILDFINILFEGLIKSIITLNKKTDKKGKKFYNYNFNRNHVLWQ